VPLRPSAELAVILDLARRVARQLERPEAVRLPGPPQKAVTATLLDRIAEQLTANPERTLVVSGSRDGNVQLAVNALNEMLGNYGSTIDLARPSLQLQGDDAALGALVDEMEAGKVGALIVRDANPAHDHPRAADFRRALAKVGLTVSLAGRRDETAALTKYICPDHHALEAWGDAHPHIGLFSLRQPVIAPLFDTRAAAETLLAWAGAREPVHDWLRSVWKTEVFPHQRRHTSFEEFWDTALHDGVLPLEAERLTVRPFDVRALSRIRGGAAQAPTQDGFEMVAYPSVALGDGRQANNPWLQELPDPVTKVTWGNYASVAPAVAKRLGVVEGRVVELRAGDRRVRLPVHIQPGMPDGVVAAAVGYGRTGAGKIAANYPLEKMFPIDKELLGGADAYPFLGAADVTLHVTEQMDALAKTQRYDFQADPVTGKPRHIARETTATAFAKDPAAGNAAPHGGPSLWPGHAYEGHRWAMAIDLGACTGCSACVIACQAENNVPVVGKAEIRKHRDMAWIRIDRYYSGDEAAPDVSFQPMLCQHCDNAPCETVCPALATLHSSEGLNMQVYNRCVGTRYCSNNCPYKVRRFNWFDYARDDPVQNLVLNPDVVVRTRGVMEKCSFCVQRIAAGKRRAKEEDRRPRDGEIAPACVQSCPADAIVFGDLNDPMSRIAALAEDPRSYRVLADLGVEPAVRYLTRVRNRKVQWRNP
jgi:molybdopterin-containing oxidoreductase family iron-sulfur binding subunit